MEMVFSLLMPLVGIAFATFIIWHASVQLENTADQLASHYHLPEVIKGSMVMALSSSFPELVTVLLAGLIYHDFELGLAAIIGSAIFNILVIPGASVVIGKRTFNTDHDMIFRETQFYLISVLVIFLLLSLAVIYFPLPNQPYQGTIPPLMAVFPLLFYFIYTYLQWHQVRDHSPTSGSVESRGPQWLIWLKLVISMIFVAIGVEILMSVVLDIGKRFNIPSYLWGVTIIAIVTSLPDLFMSIKAAQHDSSESSMGNAIGSNIFDLLFIIPLGVLITGAVIVNLPDLMPLMSFLLFATLLIIVLMRQNYQLSRVNAWFLLLLYLAFIIGVSVL